MMGASELEVDRPVEAFYQAVTDGSRQRHDLRKTLVGIAPSLSSTILTAERLPRERLDHKRALAEQEVRGSLTAIPGRDAITVKIPVNDALQVAASEVADREYQRAPRGAGLALSAQLQRRLVGVRRTLGDEEKERARNRCINDIARQSAWPATGGSHRTRNNLMCARSDERRSAALVGS